jgi:hypothetical protein
VGSEVGGEIYDMEKRNIRKKISLKFILLITRIHYWEIIMHGSHACVKH